MRHRCPSPPLPPSPHGHGAAAAAAEVRRNCLCQAAAGPDLADGSPPRHSWEYPLAATEPDASLLAGSAEGRARLLPLAASARGVPAASLPAGSDRGEGAATAAAAVFAGQAPREKERERERGRCWFF
uniref:Uncharacterized protein n=1 Tax=Oryza rufipogon TaxID=4529 RepID=A0A0E0QSG9_ORYRU